MLKKVLEYTYFVEAYFNESKDIIYMDVYERRETGNMFVIRTNLIPYMEGIDDVDTLINSWLRSFSKSKMCNMWFLPAKEGFREELKKLLKENKED